MAEPHVVIPPCRPPLCLQSEDGSVLVCDGQLQGVLWYANGCQEPAVPSIYTKLCAYTRWIDEVMASSNNYPTTTRAHSIY